MTISFLTRFCENGEAEETKINESVPPCCVFYKQMGSLGPKTDSKTMIVGGSGFCGFHLGCRLSMEGYHVVLYDIRKPLWEIPNRVTFLQGDVRDYETLLSASEGIDCMFHMAAYGMSGKEQLDKREIIESINVKGTKVVIDVCKRRNIPKLIFTSTIGVVFGGIPIKDGDESLPYFPLEKQPDNYSRSKSIAEQMVLAANGSPLKGGKRLQTCALRLPGIYGPGERRHFPRIMRNIKRHFLDFRLNNAETKMNWIHVCNLVQAYVLASRALSAERDFAAGGQAYFVHDGENVNFFDWISIVYEKLGRKKPCLQLPSFFLQIAAVMGEYLYFLLKPVYTIDPFLTKTEARIVLFNNTFCIKKAEKQLGYCPEKYSLSKIVDYYLQAKPTKKEKLCSK